MRNATPLALVGGTIHASPDAAPLRDGAVLIRGGAIAAVEDRERFSIPPGTEILDCAGRTMVAGFWNSHVHFFERKWSAAAAIPAEELSRQLEEAFTRFGFTSVFDTGSMAENTGRIRDRIQSDEVAGPRIRTTGEALVARGAMPPEVVLRVMGLASFPAPEIADAAGAAAAARKLLAAGADGIKLHLQAPPPPGALFPENAIAAAASEAHGCGKPVFVHPNSAADVLAAVRGGADVIAHTTPHSGPWDERTLSAMKRAAVALTPTLSLWKAVLGHDRASIQQRVVETAVGQLRAWRGSGGEVLFGTDLGVAPDDPAEEYALMAQAGMGFRETLASLTSAPAARFGESDRLGRIAPGHRADIVVLDGDPAEDIRAFRAVRYTIRDGRIVYRAAA